MSEPTPIKIAGVQMDVTFGDVAANRAAILGGLARAADLGARLVVFPECALTGYCFESKAEAMPHAEPIPGPTTEAVARACRERGVHAVFGLLERDGDRLFNACALVGPE
jgi:predicted amidohydrolase